MTSPALSRRHFLRASLTAGTFAAALPGLLSRGQAAPSQRVTLAVTGMHARGQELVSAFTALPGVTVKYVVDVDSRYLPSAAQHTAKAQGVAPKIETDFRRVLEDRAVDALLVATPDHWHAPMALLALAAGKQVYVEKPSSHNPGEGELLVEAARKHDRLAQVGTQRRSIGNVRQMVEELRGGVIGNVFLARCFYSRRRSPIGFGKEVAPPTGLDWDLWQGPAPRAAYRDNLHPYNWHWFWNWGTGEALNNGVHLLDVARWAMNVDYPTRVNSFGGRWHDTGRDDWQTPDTQEITLEFGAGRGIAWFGRSCSTYGAPGYKANGIIFLGSQGTLDYDGTATWTVHDLDNRPVKTVNDPAGQQDEHAENFIAALRGKAKLNAPVADSHISTTLGHLGNIAHRVGRGLRTDPKTGRVLDDPAAAALWTREYAPGWEPRA